MSASFFVVQFIQMSRSVYKIMLQINENSAILYIYQV